MFRRLIFADSAAWFTLVAFITAASIYVAFGWRALRMKRAQRDRFADLPFATPTPAFGGRADPLGPPGCERVQREGGPSGSALPSSQTSDLSAS